ncbi:MAG: TetR/AcrR family transcriptional regulator [Spirochaetes bacterium]|nr:TetR/AcrR family transcriptional regulator [Spirochaetota bacterium]
MIRETVQEETTRARILRAVLEMMAQRDIDQISTREILERAGVSNSSAISYHFGSKDSLVRQALRLYFGRMRQLFGDHENAGGDPRETLMSLCVAVTGYIAENPGLEKNLLLRIIARDTIDPDFSEVMRGNLESLKKIIARATGSKNDTVLIHKAIAFMSGLVYPFLLSHYGKESIGMDYGDGNTAAGYFKSLVKGIL